MRKYVYAVSIYRLSLRHVEPTRLAFFSTAKRAKAAMERLWLTASACSLANPRSIYVERIELDTEAK
jgi:hypothetical protein